LYYDYKKNLKKKFAVAEDINEHEPGKYMDSWDQRRGWDDDIMMIWDLNRLQEVRTLGKSMKTIHDQGIGLLQSIGL
jgi:hypothetical protein